jgi:hypothetical protein
MTARTDADPILWVNLWVSFLVRAARQRESGRAG